MTQACYKKAGGGDEGMTGQRKNEAGHKPAEGGVETRRARLEQELRANLLKRKAQARARKASSTPRDEGGQTRA
jgi:hypothetical protein